MPIFCGHASGTRICGRQRRVRDRLYTWRQFARSRPAAPFPESSHRLRRYSSILRVSAPESTGKPCERRCATARIILSESPHKPHGRGLSRPDAQLIELARAAARSAPTSRHAANRQWIAHRQMAACDHARVGCRTTVDGSLRPAWCALFSSAISALETFRDLSCGTLSSHMDIWSACAVSGFCAGLQEHSNTVDASNKPSGRLRAVFQCAARTWCIV